MAGVPRGCARARAVTSSRVHTETAFIILFIVATGVALLGRRLGIPYTVALVLTGLGLGTVHAFEPPHLTHELLFGVVLPALLFEAAFHIDVRDFWRDRAAVLGLAVPGVAVATALTTVLLVSVADTLHELEPFSWRHALVFSATIAATDPIAVVGLFRNLQAPRRLALLLEGESLLNDGTSIVFFTLVLGLVTGAAVTVGGLAAAFVKVVGGGVLVGLAVGFAVSLVIQRVDDPMIEITLTTIAAYGAFVAAEQLGFSGVIGTVTAGMLCGNYGARTGMSPSTRIAAQTFWEYAAFALNSIVFLLIGLEVHVRDLLASWGAILLAYGAVTLGRALVIFGVSGLLSRTPERIPLSWSAVLTWGGLRGALSMVLALSLAADFPHRSTIVTLTFGVVVLSILLQGLTMGPLLRRLGIVRGSQALAAYDLARGRSQAAGAALAELNAMEQTRMIHPKVLQRLRTEYEGQARAAEEAVEDLHLKVEEVGQEEFQRARRRLLLVEKERVLDAFRRGAITHQTYEQLLADIDARLLQPPEKAAGGGG
jgi:CPA1 family monovalent cation:H+ antiporter